jgi:lipase maturation factor 1
VRTVIWRYWFSDWATKRATGAWWRRELVGPFTGAVATPPDSPLATRHSPLKNALYGS